MLNIANQELERHLIVLLLRDKYPSDVYSHGPNKLIDLVASQLCLDASKPDYLSVTLSHDEIISAGISRRNMYYINKRFNTMELLEVAKKRLGTFTYDLLIPRIAS